MKVSLMDLQPERFYATGALFTALVYTENVHDWWTLGKLPTLLWRSLAWPLYLPQMIIYGVPADVAVNDQ